MCCCRGANAVVAGPECRCGVHTHAVHMKSSGAHARGRHACDMCMHAYERLRAACRVAASTNNVRRRRACMHVICCACMQGSIDILRQVLAGSLFFFIFRQQTSAYYFTQIVYYGGAKYIATGRGFDLTHTPFVKQFEAFGRSHIYPGFQLGLLAIMLAFLSIPQYVLSTWGTWLVAIALSFSPFWFNPATFRVDSVIADFAAWRLWLMGSPDPSTKNSWCASQRATLQPFASPGASLGPLPSCVHPSTTLCSAPQRQPFTPRCGSQPHRWQAVSMLLAPCCWHVVVSATPFCCPRSAHHRSAPQAPPPRNACTVCMAPCRPASAARVQDCVPPVAAREGAQRRRQTDRPWVQPHGRHPDAGAHTRRTGHSLHLCRHMQRRGRTAARPPNPKSRVAVLDKCTITLRTQRLP
jgi:1,3-beta-glucan synthase component